MSRLRVSAFGILYAALGIGILQAGDFSTYRGFQFGMSLPAAEKQAGFSSMEAKSVHTRPALIQEVEWLPRPSIVDSQLANSAKPDPVKEGLLYFMNGELFRMVITYDRYRIEGMKADDLIASISSVYGPETRPAGEVPYHSYYGESATVLARWEDADYSYNLVPSADRSSFALVLFSKRMEVEAQAAIAEAVRLDVLEAPQRAVATKKKQEEDDRVSLDKARTANMPNFRP